MRSFGSDRVRVSGERVILQSAIPKGWTARTPKSATHSEFPGTAVLWEEQYFEVVEATQLQSGACRYVLAPWREEHMFRTFEHYDEPSEARRIEDFRQAQKQRAASFVSRLTGILLGNLPEPVQRQLQNELGVSPSAMTLLSCILPILFLCLCIWLMVGAKIRGVPSPIPVWVFGLAMILMLESAVRFFVAMSQSRGMGTFLGTLLYILYWRISPKRATLPSPFTSPGESTTFMIPPTEDIQLRDKLEMKGPLLTLLTPAEQQRLAERYGFDYRKHAYGVTWTVLAFATIGAVTGVMSLSGDGDVGSLLSAAIAAFIAVEQLMRLSALKRGPAGSVLGAITRPFVRDLLR